MEFLIALIKAIGAIVLVFVCVIFLNKDMEYHYFRSWLKDITKKKAKSSSSSRMR